jgi:hypothetical protein
MSLVTILYGIGVTIVLWACNKAGNFYADQFLEKHKPTADRQIEWISTRIGAHLRWVAVFLGSSSTPVAPPGPPPPVPSPAPSLPVPPVVPTPDPTTRDTDLVEVILDGLREHDTATGYVDILKVTSRIGVTDRQRVGRVARMLRDRGLIHPLLEPSDSIHGKITGEAVIYFEKHGSFRGILGH